MKVVCGEVRAEIGSVAQHAPVLHQAVSQEDLLSGHHVRFSKEDLAIDQHLFRDGRLVAIVQGAEQSEEKETENENKCRRLQPAPRDEQGASFWCRAHFPSMVASDEAKQPPAMKSAD